MRAGGASTKELQAIAQLLSLAAGELPDVPRAARALAEVGSPAPPARQARLEWTGDFRTVKSIDSLKINVWPPPYFLSFARLVSVKH